MGDARTIPNVSYGDLQPRMLCTLSDHRGADVGPSWLLPLQFWFGWASRNK
jgi:hypothetical protein